MRAMLLDRADRQDRHHALGVETSEILGGEIPPPMRFENHGSIVSHQADVPDGSVCSRFSTRRRILKALCFGKPVAF
jgi:hypothetical protein